MKYVVIVPDEVIEELQNKDVEVVALSELIKQLMITHLLDKDDALFDKPIIQKCREQLYQAQAEFIQLQRQIATDYLPQNAPEDCDWSLNYYTGCLYWDDGYPETLESE